MPKKKILVTALLVVLLVGTAAGSYLFGYSRGRLEPQNLIIKGVSNMTSDKSIGDADFSTFWQAWDLVDGEYLRNSSTTSDEKVYGAIRGLMASLNDPYSTFFSPEENKKFEETIQGNFGGIGAEIGMKKGQIVIIAPLKDTPAMKAGLKAGDIVLKVNTSSTEGLTIDEAVNLIRGPEGTTVTLSIYRSEWEAPKDIKIVRQIITVPTIDYRMEKNNIAYIELSSFNGNAESQFYNAVVKALSAGARGIVLDLRDDPGGYLDVANDLAGWFLPRNTVVVKEAGRNGEEQVFRANGNEALVKIPVVVLINGGSASASEILAGTLRDNRRIKLIGEQSFGKGTVQQLESLKDGSSLKITIAHWVLPSGFILENGGLKPDIEIKLTDDDIKNSRDPQLDKALEVLRQQIIAGTY